MDIFYLLYILIEFAVFFINLFFKLIYCTCKRYYIIKFNNHIRLLINEFKYNTAFVENNVNNLQIKVNNNFFPYIKVEFLETKIISFEFPERNIPKTGFKLWDSEYSLLYRDYTKFNKIIDSFSVFNIFIQKQRIDCFSDMYIELYGVNIFRRNACEYIKIKIKKLKIFYKKKCISQTNIIKLSLKKSKTIYIEHIHLLVNKLFLEDKFINIVNKIKLMFKSDESSYLPKIMIRSFRVNIYLHNYIYIENKDLIFENKLLNISKIKVKIWKKDSIWLTNFKINILDTFKTPVIENVRVRLFNSTCDKLYKTLIILRKKFMPLSNKNEKITFNSISNISVNEKYLQSINKKTQTTQTYQTGDLVIINNYLDKLDDIIIKYKFTIVNLQIKLSYNNGTLRAENLIFQKNEYYNVFKIYDWSFVNKKISYISKCPTDERYFVIKFNRDSIYITPYKLDIYFDKSAFSSMCILFKKNIDRLGHLFYSSFYIYNKGYVYETFHMASFSSKFNYKKTDKNLKKLILGNKAELLNYIEIEDLDILLEEVKIQYPKDWADIGAKFTSVYRKSLYDYNLKNILNKISGKNVSTALYLKNNYRYFKNKLKKSLNN